MSLLRIYIRNLEIQNGGSNMATKIFVDRMKLGNLSRLNAGSDHFHFLGKGTTYSGPIYGILLICEFQNGGPKMASKIVNVKGLP